MVSSSLEPGSTQPLPHRTLLHVVGAKEGTAVGANVGADGAAVGDGDHLPESASVPLVLLVLLPYASLPLTVGASVGGTIGGTAHTKYVLPYFE